MKFDNFILDIGFNRCNYDNCVYFKVYSVIKLVYLVLYIDKILISSKSIIEMHSLKTKLNSKFK